MNLILKLTGKGDEEVFVNVNNILYFVQYRESTGIVFSDQRSLSIKETGDEIMRKINNAASAQ